MIRYSYNVIVEGVFSLERDFAFQGKISANNVSEAIRDVYKDIKDRMKIHCGDKPYEVIHFSITKI